MTDVYETDRYVYTLTLSHDRGRIVVEIADTDEAQATVVEMVNFWSGYEHVSDAESYRTACARLIATRVFNEFELRSFDTGQARRLFDWNQRNGGQEGFPTLDGSSGVRIRMAKGFDDFFGPRDFQLESEYSPE